MRKSLGGSGRFSRVYGPVEPVVEVVPTGSHSDPTVPLVSIHTPQPDLASDPHMPPQTPRPRVSLQVYYVAPDAGSAAAVEAAARALETSVLARRNSGGDAGMHDRLDVYGLPGADALRCAAHQAAEIEARRRAGPAVAREWYVQRYDLGLGHGAAGWRWALVMVRKPVAEWTPSGPWGETAVGLAVVYFDRVVGGAEGRGVLVAQGVEQQDDDGGEDGDGNRRGIWVREPPGIDEATAEEDVLLLELRHDFGWQNSRGQFFDDEGSQQTGAVNSPS